MSRFTMELDDTYDELLNKIFTELGTNRPEVIRRGIILYAQKFGIESK